MSITFSKFLVPVCLINLSFYSGAIAPVLERGLSSGIIKGQNAEAVTPSANRTQALTPPSPGGGLIQ